MDTGTLSLSGFFALRKLTGPSERDVAATFQRMAEVLGRFDEAARLRFQIVSDQPVPEEQPSFWSLEVGPQGSEASAQRIDRPDFEVITTAETWWRIADGTLAPLRAFLQGQMRVRGNVEIGKRILSRLSSGKEGSTAERQPPWPKP
jgi:SCP-2 sterol transfer family